MKARVTIGGQESDPFEVLAGVKQGCVLATVIFNLFLVAVTLVFRSGLTTDGGIPFKYRLDGSMFNLRRLQAHTKVSTDTVYELRYADDAAVPSHTPSGLQDNLNTLADAYQRAGLTINTKNTEILSSGPHSSTPLQLSSQYMATYSTQPNSSPTSAAYLRLTLI